MSTTTATDYFYAVWMPSLPEQDAREFDQKLCVNKSFIRGKEENFEQGTHIICEEDELTIRTLAAKLKGEIRVLPMHPYKLMNHVWVDHLKAAEILFCDPLLYEHWIDSLSDERVTATQAAKLAEIELTSNPSPKKLIIRLEELRKRCGMSSFDWNRYIRELEAEIHAAVTARDPIGLVERFKADLLKAANEDDPIIQMLRINELASAYRMPAAEIRKAIAKTEVAIRTPKSQSFALDGFLSMESEGIDYLIPGLLPRGETVLCVGLPKSGKTLLSIDAAFAVATGESTFLGESVQQGKVLIVSVDESTQSTRIKLLKRGFRKEDGANVSVMTQWDISQMGELEKTLEDLRPDLVVIDSLKRIVVGRDVSENSAEFADIIYTLKELLGRYGAAGILIHHSNKNQEAVGVGKVRGSTAIAGACWGIWQLDPIIQTTDENGKPIKNKPKYDPTDPRRIFTSICRDAENQVKNITFNPDNHSYVLQDDDSEAKNERKTQEQQILDLLRQYDPRGLTGTEILEKLGLPRSGRNTLNRMVEKRILTNRVSYTDKRMMVYALPKKKGDTHPPSPTVGLMTNFSESTVVETKTNSHQIVIKDKDDRHQLLEETPFNAYIEGGDECLNPLPNNESEEINHQVLGVGGGVCVDDAIALGVAEPIAPQLAQNEHQKLPALKVGDRVVIKAGGKFDDQIAVVADCENQDGELLVESNGLKLWYRREFLLLSTPQGD